jgi:4-hydroxybenzoate polyprenyltransferase
MERKQVAGFIKWFRPWRTVHYVGATAFGIILGYRIIGGGIHPVQSALALVSVFFTFQGMVVLNNLMDKKIDEISGKKTPLVEGALSDSTYRAWGIVFSTLGALAGLAISYTAFLLIVAGHIASFLYSAPPFRLKRFFPISTLLLALSSYLVMMFGYSIYGLTKTFMSFPPRLSLLFIIVFALSMSFKDRLDEKGDREGGIHTLFTMLGERVGSLVNGIMMFAAYCIVPPILGYLPLYFAAIPAAVLTLVFSIRRPFREEPIFLIYFMFADIFIYVIWKNIFLVLPQI